MALSAERHLPALLVAGGWSRLFYLLFAPGTILTCVFVAVVVTWKTRWRRLLDLAVTVSLYCLALTIVCISIGIGRDTFGWYAGRLYVAIGACVQLATVFAILRQTYTDLSVSAQRLRSAFGNAAVGMALADAEGRFRLVNETLCALVGYSAQELLHRSWYDIAVPKAPTP